MNAERDPLVDDLVAEMLRDSCAAVGSNHPIRDWMRANRNRLMEDTHNRARLATDVLRDVFSFPLGEDQ